MNVIDEDKEVFRVLDFIPIKNIAVSISIEMIIDISVDKKAYTCFIKIRDEVYFCAIFKTLNYDVIVNNFKRTFYVKYNKQHHHIELYDNDNNSLLESYNAVPVHITEVEIASMLLLSQGV